MPVAVMLMDRFLSQEVVGKKKLQLVGVVVMFIAAKMHEEISPTIETMVSLRDSADVFVFLQRLCEIPLFYNDIFGFLLFFCLTCSDS